jgi:hypothetical protein
MGHAVGVATQLDECRQWLRHTQGFVLQVLKQVQGFAMDTTSSMEEGTCTTSTAPNSAASLNAWRSMCQDASDALGSVAEIMANGGAEVCTHPYSWHTRIRDASQAVSFHDPCQIT